MQNSLHRLNILLSVFVIYTATYLPRAQSAAAFSLDNSCPFNNSNINKRFLFLSRSPLLSWQQPAFYVELFSLNTSETFSTVFALHIRNIGQVIFVANFWRVPSNLDLKFIDSGMLELVETLLGYSIVYIRKKITNNVRSWI